MLPWRLFLVLLIKQTIQSFIWLYWTARMSLVFYGSISLLPWPLEWEPCPALDDGRLSFMSLGVLTMPCLPEKLSFIPKDTCLQTWQFISLGRGSCFLVLLPPSTNPAIIVHHHNRLRGWAWVSKLSHLQSKPCLRICNPQSHWLKGSKSHNKGPCRWLAQHKVCWWWPYEHEGICLPAIDAQLSVFTSSHPAQLNSIWKIK